MYPMILASHEFGFSTYFLIVSLVICFMLCLGWKRAQRQYLNLSTFVYGALLGMVVSFWTARLWYFAFVFPFSPEALLLQEKGYDRFFHWTYFFHFWQGGFVLYGGFLGATGICTLFLIWRKESLGLWADFVAPLMSLGFALGRWACFFAGCCYGKVTSLPWGLPLSLHHVSLRHPTALYAFTWEMGVFVLLKYIEKKRKDNKGGHFLLLRGNLFLIWIFLHLLGRLWIERLRGDMRGPVLYGFSLSAWVAFFLLGITGFALWIRRDTKSKGVAS